MQKRRAMLIGGGAALVAATAHAQDQAKGAVAVIGTGRMGAAVGGRFAALGYKVIFGSRDPDSDKVRALVNPHSPDEHMSCKWVRIDSDISIRSLCRWIEDNHGAPSG